MKSSRNLRVAFLRQEFVDELVETNTLREELYTSFVEERALLKAIADCEDEVGRTTDDPVTMEAVLNKLQVLQDKAIAQGVYALESKVVYCHDISSVYVFILYFLCLIFSLSESICFAVSFTHSFSLSLTLSLSLPLLSLSFTLTPSSLAIFHSHSIFSLYVSLSHSLSPPPLSILLSTG